MTVGVEEYVRLIRRTLLRPARPVPAGRGGRLAAWVAGGGMLVYAVLKVYMALRGEIGMPGSPAPAAVQARFEHPALAQAGNAVLGVGAGLVVWAAVAHWGGRIPRWALLGSLALALLMQILGAVVTVGREGLAPADGGWTVLLDRAASGAQLAAWCVVTVSYAVRTRARAAGAASR